MNFFVDSILYSYAQIFFSNRRWLGGVILAATFLVPQMGLLALLGVTLSNLTAYVLKFDETKIRSGFYGFNGILFGAAVAFYFKLSFFIIILTLLFIVITFFISAVLEHHMASVFNLPGLSLPFIVSLYIFLIFVTNFGAIERHVVIATDVGLFSVLPASVQSFFKSLAFVVYQPNALAGATFAIAFLILSRVMFILSIVGFLTSTITVHLMFGQPSESLVMLAGLNAALTALALGGNLIIPSPKSFTLAVICSVMIVVLTGFFAKLLSHVTLPVVVLPFNFAVLSVLYSLKFRREQSNLVLLYFLPGTPEENFYYHHNRVSRFERFKAVIPELPFYGEWLISQGHRGDITHKDKWKFAWDFVVIDASGSEFSGKGTTLKDYYCYNLPVIAPLEGIVVRVVDGIPDNAIGETNIASNWGNTVIVDHGSGVFSSASHLVPQSIKVAVGDKVKKGDALGACGNSGRSPTPHLHFQFQATDKLGDKTIEYPIGQYLDHKDGEFALHSFDIPQQGMTVQNVGAHKLIKKAFDFKLGDKLAFDCTMGSEKFSEEWEVKVDVYNTLYIESSAKATVTIAVVGKVFYLTNFIGSKRSALYHFYLTAIQVPLCYEPRLGWTDDYPLSKMLSGYVRYLSELFLIFKPQLRTTARFTFNERTPQSSDFVIANDISAQGSGLFAFYKRTWQGTLTISDEGTIREIVVHAPLRGRRPEPIDFQATAKFEEDKSE